MTDDRTPTESSCPPPDDPLPRTSGRSEIYSSTNFGNVYAAVVQTRNTEATLNWTRYNIMGVMVFLFLMAVMNARPDTLIVANWQLVCSAGILISFLWLAFTITGRRLVLFWEHRVISLEENSSNWKVFTQFKGSPRLPFYRGLILTTWQSFREPYTWLSVSLPCVSLVLWAWSFQYHPQSEAVSAQLESLNQRLIALGTVHDSRIQTLQADIYALQQQLSSTTEGPKVSGLRPNTAVQRAPRDRTAQRP